MGVRIWAQSIFGEDHRSYSREGYAVINEGIERLYAKVLSSDTKVNVSFVEKSTYLTSHSHLELFNNAEILKGILRAEHEGYDVAFVRCGNDPAIREGREPNASVAKVLPAYIVLDQLQQQLEY